MATTNLGRQNEKCIFSHCVHIPLNTLANDNYLAPLIMRFSTARMIPQCFTFTERNHDTNSTVLDEVIRRLIEISIQNKLNFIMQL